MNGEPIAQPNIHQTLVYAMSPAGKPMYIHQNATGDYVLEGSTKGAVVFNYATAQKFIQGAVKNGFPDKLMLYPVR